jgi:uncharacterized phage protein (TIGR02216 family)
LIAAAGTPAFPWAEAMSLGLGLLRLTPKGFWSMSPIELAHAAGLFAASAPDRSALDTMMARFPERRKE